MGQFAPRKKQLTTDPEKILNELNTKINDNEILDEIKDNFDFSSEKLFLESFKDNYLSNSEESTLFKDTVFEKGIESLSPQQIYTIAPETIVLKFGRPSLLIQNGDIERPESKVWKNRLDTNIGNILNSIPSVGRIELIGHSTYDWVGTGWLYEDTGLLITNRHVAELFIREKNGQLRFKQNLEGKTIKSYIDFKEEYKVDEDVTFKIKDIVYMASEDVPDVAILEVKTTNEDDLALPFGLSISTNHSNLDSLVFTIGYPAKDSRIKDSSLMEKIFKNVYDVKRFAPGKLTDNSNYEYEYHHDCSTLGGNSGSPLIDLESGEVVGLHFAGTYRKYNWAVQNNHLNNLLNSLT